MTSPTAYPEDNGRYDGAIEELATELEREFPKDREVMRQLLVDAVDAGDDALIDAFAAVIHTAYLQLAKPARFAANGPVSSAACTVAIRRIDARLKSDPDFRTFIDSGKWPRGSDV